MNNAIETFFVWCVELMRFLANMSGMAYKEINVYIFLVLQPALIILFFGEYKQLEEKNMETFTDSDETE